MPKVFEYIGFIFYFFSNDHDPVHCHVKKGDKDVKVELYFSKERLERVSITKANRHTEALTGEEREKIRKFVSVHYAEIRKKWDDFRSGKKVVSTKINKEIK